MLVYCRTRGWAPRVGSPQGKSVQWDSVLMLWVCASRAGLLPVVCGLRLEYPLTHPPDVAVMLWEVWTSQAEESHPSVQSILVLRDQCRCQPWRSKLAPCWTKICQITINAEVILNCKFYSQLLLLCIISLKSLKSKGIV